MLFCVAFASLPRAQTSAFVEAIFLVFAFFNRGVRDLEIFLSFVHFIRDLCSNALLSKSVNTSFCGWVGSLIRTMWLLLNDLVAFQEHIFLFCFFTRTSCLCLGLYTPWTNIKGLRNNFVICFLTSIDPKIKYVQSLDPVLTFPIEALPSHFFASRFS